MAGNNAIVVQGLKKTFKKLAVLSGVDFVVEHGTILALLGPNGAGKTTIIRILSTLLAADSGVASVNGFDVKSHGQQVRENIGLTGQYAAVDEYLTGVENLEMMGRLYHLSKANAKLRAQELLEQFDLVEAGSRAVKTYSGGMRRRLDLAASLIASPPVLFLDEPTTGLDPRSRLAMWKIIERLVQSGVSILLTTQYLEEADQLADKIAVIDGGKIIAQGTADELKAKVGNERLELVIKNPAQFAQAITVIGGKILEQNAEKSLVSVSTNGDVSEVTNALTRLQQAHIAVESLSLHKPTLDDVFLHLTGHKAEKESSEQTGEKK